MKVKFKEDIFEWKAGVVYQAEPVFFNGKQLVKVFLPGSKIVVSVPWDGLEVVE